MVSSKGNTPPEKKKGVSPYSFLPVVRYQAGNEAGNEYVFLQATKYLQSIKSCVFRHCRILMPHRPHCLWLWLSGSTIMYLMDYRPTLFRYNVHHWLSDVVVQEPLLDSAVLRPACRLFMTAHQGDVFGSPFIRLSKSVTLTTAPFRFNPVQSIPALAMLLVRIFRNRMCNVEVNKKRVDCSKLNIASEIFSWQLKHCGV